jgi:signal transduction histidine kinase
MAHDYQGDIDAISRIESVATILDVVCRITGMGFAAVARVTQDRWITCAAKDDISFGLVPGSELDVKTTICDEIRDAREGVVIDHVAADPTFRTHHTPLQYGFQSYISMPIIREDGSVFGTLCAIDPKPAQLNNPETIGMFKLFAKLIAAQLDAEDKLALVNHSLIVQQREAELREQFIAILGHDLRNPVSAISGAASLLLRESPNEKSKLVLSMMQSSVHRMTSLIDNMLDFARGRLGSGIALERISDFPIETTLNHVVDEIRAANPNRTIQTSFDAIGEVYADHDRIAQLFSNLMANAVVHGSVDHPVRASAFLTEGTFVLTVANAGRQISEHEVAHLFQPFHRRKFGDNRQGLGLGLYIVSQIAEAHGGKVLVASSAIETRFTFTMPADARREATELSRSIRVRTPGRPLASFWDFVVGQRFGPNPWGDFVHRLSRGEVERPTEVKHWREVKAMLDAHFIDADAREIRKAWKAFKASSASEKVPLP